jgi:hypothetical protein
VQTPAPRRLKTYTAATGYVYQYYFVGKREALPDAAEAPATEFIFDVTPDRKTTYAISVFVKPEALDTWAATHGRSLSEPEQYAATKLRLHRGFDEITDFRHHSRRLTVDAGNIEDLLADLALE